jgi:hypothetical protein
MLVLRKPASSCVVFIDRVGSRISAAQADLTPSLQPEKERAARKSVGKLPAPAPVE